MTAVIILTIIGIFLVSAGIYCSKNIQTEDFSGIAAVCGLICLATAFYKLL